MESKLQSLVHADPTDAVISRPLANFHPNVWGNHFLKPVEEPNNASLEESHAKIEVLKHDLKKELSAHHHNPIQQLQLIDAIQRLGIEYHFETEVDQALHKMHETIHDFCEVANYYDDSLRNTALVFRLLRQQGHNISSDVFEKFKDGNEFKASIIEDVEGLLELYEAAHLSLQGEDILDHALDFTRNNLQSILPDLRNPIAEQVSLALNKFSNRRGLTRLGARHYISVYEQLGSHHQGLLRLAKLDFNILQTMHKKELHEVCSWWDSLDVPNKFPYVRNRIVECYFWILGVYFEPQYSLARTIEAKVLGITSLLDDTYDSYATFEELEIFTEAMERWNIACIDSLPEYMKVLYKIILDLFEDIEDQMIELGTTYRLEYGKEAIKILARAYFAEAKWLKERYTPGMEEYMEVATSSCGYTSVVVTSFLGMGNVVTKEAFDWVLTIPDTLKATLIICRLVADMAAHEFERERDHIPSAVEVYMIENNATKQEAITELNNRVHAAWQDINQGFLRPTKFPVAVLYRMINFVRVIEVMHKNGNYYTKVGPEMKSYIKQLLIDPIAE